MSKITFLAASVPLTKTIEQTPAGLIVQPYPHIRDFTSHTLELPTIVEFCKELIKRQSTGQCLLKGRIQKELTKEPRAGSTNSETVTDWICLDLDKAPFPNAEAFMTAMGLSDVSYTIQFSASHGLPDSVGLSCHIFCYLDRPMPAPQLKNWLIHRNIKIKELKDGLRLSRTAIALSYPLDITTCQNDKLLYFNAPVFRGMNDPVKNRIQFIKKKLLELPTERIGLHAPEALKKLCREILNEKRMSMVPPLPALKTRTSIVGEFEVQNNPGVMTITGGPREDGEWVRFNINGGSNWSYYHPANNPELLHNFKGEPCVRIKDVFPEYYKECVAKRRQEQSTPSEDGDLLLVFRDRKTASYWNGTWNPKEQKLTLDPAKSETQLAHFMLSHGRAPHEFIPIWDKIFDPSSDIRVDVDQHTVNMFTPSEYMRNMRRVSRPSLAGCPTIQRILDSAVGTGAVQEHFLNWLAVMIQLRVKPITAWVLHGTQGTGKGLLINKILSPIFGRQYVEVRIQNELMSDFSGWLEFALIAFIDEIDVNALEHGGIVDSKLKAYITEPTIPIRRMRQESYSAPSYTGFIFASNKPHMVHIPQGDRRYNVGQYQAVPLKITIDEIEQDIPCELQAFTDYLNSRAADRKLAATPLHTEERENIMTLSRTSVDTTAGYLTDGNLEGLWEAMPDEKTVNEMHGMTPFATYASAFAAIMRRSLTDYIEKRETKLSREELGTIFEYCVGNVSRSPHKLTSYLKHHGIKLEKLRIGNEVLSGMRVNWFCSDAFLAEVSKGKTEAPTKLRRAK